MSQHPRVEVEGCEIEGGFAAERHWNRVGDGASFALASRHSCRVIDAHRDTRRRVQRRPTRRCTYELDQELPQFRAGPTHAGVGAVHPPLARVEFHLGLSRPLPAARRHPVASTQRSGARLLPLHVEGVLAVGPLVLAAPAPRPDEYRRRAPPTARRACRVGARPMVWAPTWCASRTLVDLTLTARRSEPY